MKAGGRNTMVRLFEPGRIGNVEIKNRIVMSPIGTEFWGCNGEVTDQLMHHYEAIARGGVGLIVLSFASVDYPKGYGVLGSLYSRAMLPGHFRLVERVHAFGAKIALQLMHRGRQVSQQRGLDIVSSSPVRCLWLGETPRPVPRQLDRGEIYTIMDHYALLAAHAKYAGYDMVEIHGGHGYLVNSFMSSYLNKRTDEFGGNIQNRMRFSTELIRRIKEETGDDFPIGFRISADEFIEGGTTIHESPIMARMLEDAGAAYIHVSSGLHETSHKVSDIMRLPEGWKSYIWEAVNKAVKIPVIAVGGNRNPQYCESVLEEGKADFIGLGRPLIADPGWPIKAAEGRFEDIRKCVSCLECLGPMTGRRADTRCTVNVVVGRREQFAKLDRTSNPKKIMIIGGGPAGMEAARIAAIRGHGVTLYERMNELGGQLLLASVPPGKQRWLWFRDYLEKQLEKLNVAVKLGTEVEVSQVEREKADAVIIATGAEPCDLDIPGIPDQQIVHAWDLLRNGVRMENQRVVIIGGGIVGAETADYLAEMGNEVTIVEQLHDIAIDMEPLNRKGLMDALKERNVVALTGHSACEAAGEGLSVLEVDSGEKKIIACDRIIMAAGARSNSHLADALRGKISNIRSVGDCLEPRSVMSAVYEGAFAALQV